MANRRGRKNLGTAILGVALILVGVVLLGVELAPALASRLELTPYERKYIKACNEDILPFDSYESYMPHLVRLSFPAGQRLARFRLNIGRAVNSAFAEARHEIRQGIEQVHAGLRVARQALLASRRALAQVFRAARQSVRISLRALPSDDPAKARKAGSPDARPEEGPRQAI